MYAFDTGKVINVISSSDFGAANGFDTQMEILSSGELARCSGDSLPLMGPWAWCLYGVWLPHSIFKNGSFAYISSGR